MRARLINLRPLTRLLLLTLATASYADVRIEGVDGELARNVRLFTALSDEPCDAPYWRVRRRFSRLAADTRRALEPFGYYNAIVDTSLEFAAECWTAVVDIDAGLPTTWRNIRLDITGEAASDPTFMTLPGTESLVAGNRVDHRAYETVKRNLQVRAADRGYVDMAITEARIDVWPEDNAADLT
ncbi:MAG: POTRA domain-containing protein, partial [Pseudomonadota bacterium]